MKEKPEKSSNGYYNFKDGQSKKRVSCTWISIQINQEKLFNFTFH